MHRKTIIIVIAVITLSNCIDPYKPKLNGYESLLVVDGLITDENLSNTIRLSRTIMDQNSIPPMITDANVFISDEAGNRNFLDNKGNGIYKTDSTVFKGVIGQTYTLHVVTSEGSVYESEPCQLQWVPEIDSIYYDKDKQLINNGTESIEGLSIYLDSKEGLNNNYFRWDFEETWEYKIPDPRKFTYIDQDHVIAYNNVREYCWKSRKSGELIIHRIYSGESDIVKKKPIYFIAPGKSERLSLHYSILVKQYSISKKEYDFWSNLKLVNQAGEDIFAAQPFPVISNIHNINNPKEQVLGYFRVSAVKQKRMEIPYLEIVRFELPNYQYPCVRIEDSPNILPWVKFTPPLTWDDIYEMYTTSGYAFVEPKYLHGTKTLDRLVFTKPECANCELTGTSDKPDFWTDLK